MISRRCPNIVFACFSPLDDLTLGLLHAQPAAARPAIPWAKAELFWVEPGTSNAATTGTSAEPADLRHYLRSYSRRAVGSHGIVARRWASKCSIASLYSSVTSISSIPRTSLSLRKGLISKVWVVRSGAVRRSEERRVGKE